MIKRRDAIVALAAVCAVAVGKRVKAQDVVQWHVDTPQPPSWFSLMISEGGGLEFRYKGDTVKITADELWAALKTPAEPSQTIKP